MEFPEAAGSMDRAARGAAEIVERRAALAVLAAADAAEMTPALEALPSAARFETVRQPEHGLVMARGRIGGGGAPFNLGEVTVTRAVVRLASGEVGFGHVLGRDKERALLVAKLDALWQAPGSRGAVEAAVLAPVRRRLAAEDAATRRRTEATRVNFFTLVRGEDK
jgi:alpha-D-ribose 1-methylphosphonate 5-triphosphate synthase subunit PhnG